MPAAFGAGGKKYHYLAYDTAYLDQVPVQNTWYTVLEDEDVRLLWCRFEHINDDSDPQDMEIRWTLDTHVFFQSAAGLNGGTPRWVYRNFQESAAGTQGLIITADEYNADKYTDIRAQNCKIEIRMTSAPVKNPAIHCWVVYETLEET